MILAPSFHSLQIHKKERGKKRKPEFSPSQLLAHPAALCETVFSDSLKSTGRITQGVVLRGKLRTAVEAEAGEDEGRFQVLSLAASFVEQC